jgi:glycosyltransferase involved in cell wall biosynthesis
MRILYDYAAFMMQPRGGVSRVMQELIAYGLHQEGVECSAWAGLHQNIDFERMSKAYPQQLHGYKLPSHLAKIRLMQPINNLLFSSYAKKYQPDICHYTFFMTPSVPVGTKVVITVHDLIHELFGKHFPKGDRQADHRRKALSVADGIVCVSKQTRDDLLNLYDIEEDKVVVAYNGNSMDSIEFPLLPKVDYPYFLYVGTRDTWRKNFEVILRALSSEQTLSEYRLICFGGKPFTDAERKKINQAGLASRILHAGGSDEELAGYYKNAAALIYPSRYEGFGLPPLEAMTFGCPVVASSAPPMPEIIDQSGLYFDPESEEDLVGQLRRAIARDPDVEQIIRNGYERSKLFTWKHSCEKIHNFYTSLHN